MRTSRAAQSAVSTAAPVLRRHLHTTVSSEVIQPNIADFVSGGVETQGVSQHANILSQLLTLAGKSVYTASHTESLTKMLQL